MAFRISLSGMNKATAAEDEEKTREAEARKKAVAAALKGRGDEDDSDNDEEDRREDREDHDPNIFVPQGARRHFAGKLRSTQSGPGTLDDEPGSFAPPGFGSMRRETDHQTRHTGGNMANIYNTVIAKLSNMPPDTSEDSVAQLFADYPSLQVVKVEQLRPPAPGKHFIPRPSVSMKVTFGQSATIADFDAAMTKMNDKKYLGCGYYLHLDRYRGDDIDTIDDEKRPFGARYMALPKPKGFAPSSDLGGVGFHHEAADSRERLVITAYPPPDLPTLRRIHNTVACVLRGGKEFEAALMAREQTKTDERMAFLYDSSHPLARYYRFRLHQMASGDHRSRIEIYEGHGEWWSSAPLVDEFAYSIGTLGQSPISANADDLEPHETLTIDPYPGMVTAGNGYLTPENRALLVFLLADFQYPVAAVKNDQVAAVYQFAVTNSTEGLDEIVDLIVSNILTPFCLMPANPNFRPITSDEEWKAFLHRNIPTATLNALKMASDLAMVGSQGFGKSWKYREAIGAQLYDRKVFHYLHNLPPRVNMGTLKLNNYRQGVNAVLNAWKQEAIFDEKFEFFDDAFNGAEKEKEREREKAHWRALTQGVSKDSDKVRSENDGGLEDENESHHVKEQTANLEVQFPRAAGQDKDPESEVPGETAAARARRLRPKAEDMFLSDEE